MGKVEIQDIPIANATNEDISTTDRQNGSGDGLLNSIPAPANCTARSIKFPTQVTSSYIRYFLAAPVSEVQRAKPESAETPVINDYGISGAEIRDFLMPIVGCYYKKEDDLNVLESMNSQPAKQCYINEVSTLES